MFLYIHLKSMVFIDWVTGVRFQRESHSQQFDFKDSEVSGLSVLPYTVSYSYLINSHFR